MNGKMSIIESSSEMNSEKNMINTQIILNYPTLLIIKSLQILLLLWVQS